MMVTTIVSNTAHNGDYFEDSNVDDSNDDDGN